MITKEQLHRGYIDLPKDLWDDLTLLGKVFIGVWMMPAMYIFVTFLFIVWVIGFSTYRGIVLSISLFIKSAKE